MLIGESQQPRINGNADSAVELDATTDKITGQFSELLNNDFTVSIEAKWYTTY